MRCSNIWVAADLAQRLNDRLHCRSHGREPKIRHTLDQSLLYFLIGKPIANADADMIAQLGIILRRDENRNHDQAAVLHIETWARPHGPKGEVESQSGYC